MRQLINNASLCLAACAALSLASCGGEGDSHDHADGSSHSDGSSSSSSSSASNADASGAHSGGDHASSMSGSEGSSGSASSGQAHDDSAPVAALRSFANAMRNAEFLTAAQYCATDSRMQSELFMMAEEFENLKTRDEEDPDFKGRFQMARMIVVQPWSSFEITPLSESGESAEIGIDFGSASEPIVYPMSLIDGQWLIDAEDASLFPVDAGVSAEVPSGPPAPKP